MDILNTESSSKGDSSNQLLLKKKKSLEDKAKEQAGIFPKELLFLNRINSLKEQLNNITFEQEGKYLSPSKKLFFRRR